MDEDGGAVEGMLIYYNLIWGGAPKKPKEAADDLQGQLISLFNYQEFLLNSSEIKAGILEYGTITPGYIKIVENK